MTTKLFFDQVGGKVSITAPPRRIVSLVPSQTELLYHLGLDEEVIGITKFCIHPEHWLKTKTITGGTKHFWFDVIDGLKPDLIIGNKEENYLEGIEMLREKYPVWISDVYNLADALTMIKSIGELVNRTSQANVLIEDIKVKFGTINKCKPKRVLYMIWRNPWMAVASDTFIHHMLETLGLVNCLQHKVRYPVVTAEDIAALNPEVIMLSSEPFPFQEKHISELRQICPDSNILFVDGEMFSWPGSRLRLAPDYFNSISKDL